MTRALWVPWATRVDVPLRESQKVTMVPQGLVRHTAVSDATIIRPTGTTRWHFYLNETGRLYQFFPVNRPAACQLDGNFWRVDGQGRGQVSCESWDGAGRVWDGRRVADCPPWNPAQLATWSRLDLWLYLEWDIPLVKIPSPRGRGIGYHAQFTNTEPYEWTSSHACPAARRIAQMDDILAASRKLAQPKPPPPPPDPEPAPKPTQPQPTPQEEFMAGIPAQLVRVKGEPAVYAVTLTGAVHVKNPTHLRFLQQAGWVTDTVREITAVELSQLLEKETGQ